MCELSNFSFETCPALLIIIMFRKPHDVSASARSLQRSKETKDLHEAMARLFAGAAGAKAVLDASLPQKGVESAKLNGSKTVAYSAVSDHVPLIIDLNPKSPLASLLPTVYLLWRCPDLLPVVIVHSPVSSYILNGADLMLPGVIVQPDASLPSGSTLPDFAAGALVAIRAAGNAMPFAVGITVMSSAAARGGGMRGRGVEVLHAFRDELWVAGGRAVPNAGFLPGQVVLCGHEPLACLRGARDDDDDEGAQRIESAIDVTGMSLSNAAVGDRVALPAAAPSAECGEPEAEPSGAGDGVARPRAAAADPHRWWESVSADELMLATLLQVLRRHLRPSDLPLLGSQLLGQAMAAARPAGSTLEVKRTRWRKFGAFLRAVNSSGAPESLGGAEDVMPGVSPAALAGLLVVEEDAARGTATVRAFNAQHPLVIAHKPWPAAAEAGGASAASGAGDSQAASASSSAAAAATGDSYLPPVLHEWVQPSAAAATVCSAVALSALRAGRRPLGSVAPARGMWLFEPSLQHSGTLPAADKGSSESRMLARGPASGRAPPILFTRAQAAALLQEYIALRGLELRDNKRLVACDDRLADALLGQGQGVRSHAASAAPLSEAHFPSLPGARAKPAPAMGPSVGGGGGSRDAWDDDGGVAGAEKRDDEGKCAEDHGEEECSSDDDATEPWGPTDEPPVVPDPRSAIPKEEAAKLWLQRFTPFYSLTFPAHHAAAATSSASLGGGCVGCDAVLKKGVPPTVRVYTKKLQGGRKHTTHVVGLAPYRLEPERVARDAARVFAAAGTTGPCATDPTVTEAVLQGEWGPELLEMLAAAPPRGFGLPKRVLQLDSEGTGGRKGR